MSLSCFAFCSRNALRSRSACEPLLFCSRTALRSGSGSELGRRFFDLHCKMLQQPIDTQEAHSRVTHKRTCYAFDEHSGVIHQRPCYVSA